jgi:AI-2E family transporter
MSTDSYEKTERKGFAIFMILAPLIVLAACIIHPPHGAENPTEYYQAAHDHSDQFYVSHTLFFLGGVVMLPAIIGLARLVQRSQPKQQIVQPIAYGAALGIHPLAVLVVTIAGGALFGGVGLVLAAPLTAATVRIAADLSTGAQSESAPGAAPA